jgi:hypothetical protein
MSSVFFFPFLKGERNSDPPHVYVIIDNKMMIELTWENIKKYGTLQQISHLDTFRKKYVKYLFSTYCNSGSLCKYQRIGKTTPLSNVDINLEKFYSKHAIFKYDIHEIIRNIITHHHKYFKNDLETLFDVNIYGAVLKLFDKKSKSFYIPEYVTNHEQRCWACLRLVKIGIEYNILDKIEESFKTECYKTLIQDTRNKLAKLKSRYDSKNRTNMYMKFLKKYYTLVENDSPVKSVIKMFSLCKYFESDAYNSAGAYLHIVMKRKKLSDGILTDSVFDNIGFLFESFMKYNDEKKRLDKCAKYMLRVFDALQHMSKVNDKQSIDYGFDICSKAMNKKQEIK